MTTEKSSTNKSVVADMPLVIVIIIELPLSLYLGSFPSGKCVLRRDCHLCNSKHRRLFFPSAEDPTYVSLRKDPISPSIHPPMTNIIVTALALIGHANGFNLQNIFKPPTIGKVPASSSKVDLVDEELQLLRKISNTGNGKDANIETQASVLTIVRLLETRAGPSPTLLSDAVANDPAAKSLLDGEWFLQYTAPSEIDDVTIAKDGDKWEAIEGSEGESKISTRKFKGAGQVSGGGIPVDASNTLALQAFDIDKLRVKNVITTGIGKVTVGGTFRQSTTVPLRAIIAFDTAKIELNLGPTIDISFLFDIRGLIKGTKEAGWLETTYISKNMRVGRGNKGSMFILTRDRDAMKESQ